MNGKGPQPVDVVLGAQWYVARLFAMVCSGTQFVTRSAHGNRGDEGKGKLVDVLCEDADIVVRCQVGVASTRRERGRDERNSHNVTCPPKTLAISREATMPDTLLW